MSLDGINQVQIETNNRCSYAYLHPKCPASEVKETRYLESHYVYAVLSFLGREGYAGEVMFSIYNEPLEDPRLFSFLQMMRDECPYATPYVITNGRCLDQYMLRQLVEAGARVIANGYTSDEAARLRTLKGAGYSVRESGLDRRKGMYDHEPLNLSSPCHAPKRNLAIYHTGEVGLCCRDWKRTVTFGDLHDSSLPDILEGQNRQTAIDLLEDGVRTLDVCSRCPRVWG